MSQAKLVILFFVRLALFYAVFLIPWPGVRDAYASGFRVGANFLFRTFGERGRAYFDPLDLTGKGFDAYDTQIVLRNLGTGARGTIPGMNSRLMGYLPMAFAATLILATPVNWKRRVVGLCLGMALMSAFVAFDVWLHLMDVWTDATPLGIYAPPPWGRSLFVAALNVVGRSPVTAYIAPVFVWLLVLIRREDVERWANLPARGRRRLI